ncbi:MAG: alpha/beta hydrolase [Flavobacteriales bacterium]|nr:alpha/beta hydrolase [Flavobacteriales bacterium]
MKYEPKKEGKYTYIDVGSGTLVVILHGLMGGLSNFDHVIEPLVKHGYRVLIPSLPLYTISILRASVRGLSSYIHRFIKHMDLGEFYFLGNSLGGHISLVYTRKHPKYVKGLILTGSSGLYENTGSSYPKRGSRDYIEEKTREVFYDPNIATEELIDEVFEIVSNRSKVIHTLSISKSALRHNMEKELPKIAQPTLLIWGKNDIVTPAEVGAHFHSLLPHSTLHYIDKCGHAPMMEHPIIFNKLLLEWLQEQEKVCPDTPTPIQTATV